MGNLCSIVQYSAQVYALHVHISTTIIMTQVTMRPSSLDGNVSINQTDITGQTCFTGSGWIAAQGEWGLLYGCYGRSFHAMIKMCPDSTNIILSWKFAESSLELLLGTQNSKEFVYLRHFTLCNDLISYFYHPFT